MTVNLNSDDSLHDDLRAMAAATLMIAGGHKIPRFQSRFIHRDFHGEAEVGAVFCAICRYTLCLKCSIPDPFPPCGELRYRETVAPDNSPHGIRRLKSRKVSDD